MLFVLVVVNVSQRGDVYGYAFLSVRASVLYAGAGSGSRAYGGGFACVTPASLALPLCAVPSGSQHSFLSPDFTGLCQVGCIVCAVYFPRTCAVGCL